MLNNKDSETNQDVCPGCKEEYSKELSPNLKVNPGIGTGSRKNTLGLFSIILSILAIFLMRIAFVIAPISIIIGLISARKGSKLGLWGAGIGVLSLIIMIIAVPFYVFY